MYCRKEGEGEKKAKFKFSSLPFGLHQTVTQVTNTAGTKAALAGKRDCVGIKMIQYGKGNEQMVKIKDGAGKKMKPTTRSKFLLQKRKKAKDRGKV